MKYVELHISNQLTDDDWKVLKFFCDKARRLAATRIGSGQTEGISGNIRYEITKGLWFEAKIPAEELIAEFLMAFRFFYLEKEPTHFPRILGLIGKHTSDSDARKSLKVLGKQWNDSLFRKALNITYHGKPITSGLLLDLWFNAHYFHQDEEKERELKELIKGFSEEFGKYMLLDATFEASKVVFNVFDGLQGIVDEHFASE